MKIDELLYTALEIGKWLGEVEFEERLDREQHGTALLETFYSLKRAMPLYEDVQNNQIVLSLRSKAWRTGVRKDVEKYFNQLVELGNKVLK